MLSLPVEGAPRLRTTQSRKGVLRVLTDSGEAHTAPDIRDLLRAQGVSQRLSVIHRVLRDLASAGLVAPEIDAAGTRRWKRK